MFKVGLNYKLWADDPWKEDMKPLLITIPTGKPHMQVPNYKVIERNHIWDTVEKMHAKTVLSDLELASWNKRLFTTMPDAMNKWEERLRCKPVRLPVDTIDGKKGGNNIMIC